MPPSTRTDLERLAVLEAVDDHRVATRARRRVPSTSAARWIALRAHPRARGVGALTVEARLEHEHALAAGLDPRVGGLEQHREVAVEELGLLVEDRAEPVEPVGDFFALVERERDVVAGTLGMGVSSSARRSSTASPPFMSAEPRPCSDVAVDRRDLVAVGGHGVEVTTEHDAAVAPELRAGDHAVAEASIASDGARVRSRSSTIAASSAS